MQHSVPWNSCHIILKLYILLLASPRMSMPIADAVVKPGEVAMFYCSADGVPDPSYLWYINGVPLAGRYMTYSNALTNITGHLIG